MTQYPYADPTTAVEIAIAHGLLQRTQAGALTHCPLMLSPTSITETLLETLNALVQPSALLIHRVANNLDFLAEQLQRTTEADDYTRFLLSLALEEQQRPDLLQFSITRSDYFVVNDGEKDRLRQVEFNTIAASYVGLSEHMTQFHKIWHQIDPGIGHLVQNQPLQGVADAFTEVMNLPDVDGNHVLFVIQENERNTFDQRSLEIALLARGIPVIRASLEAIGERGSLRNGHLIFNGEVIAITYFRAGYRPADLDTAVARQGRKLISQSNSISVPNLATHLAGTKKIQQVISAPHQLRQFLDEPEAHLVEQSFAPMATLDESIQWQGQTVLASEAAIAHPHQFVLKPQREGGGFNLYDDAIRQRLVKITDQDRHAYILMERLFPITFDGWGLRDGQVWHSKVVSEIGQFGVLCARGDEMLFNRGVGYLVRTKRQEMDEGGISSGAGHLNSLTYSAN